MKTENLTEAQKKRLKQLWNYVEKAYIPHEVVVNIKAYILLIEQNV